ncbi:MAG: EAL domain-containing protein [Treponema sp.]|nr:EAL domain-containing protein [Treponema sp.]
MRNANKSIMVFKLICVLFLISCMPVRAKQVLFISSYSESYELVGLQKKGLHAVFDSAGIPLDVEYMDMKQYNTPENVRLFYEHLAYKLRSHSKYDAVVTGDDAALHFAEKYQSELFKDIPIVFFCVNDIAYAEHFDGNPMITGAVENFYLKDTVDIALRFQPQTEQITGIYDDTLSGTGDRKQFNELKKDFRGYTFSAIDSSVCSPAEFRKRLTDIPPDSVVLYLNAAEDKNGTPYTIPESVRLITEYCRAPVYRTGIGGIGEGLIGGKVVSYEDSGKKAASMVMAVFNGTDIASLHVVTNGESRYIFDYRILKKYGIGLRLVPENAVIINKPKTLLERYEPLLRPVLIILSTLLLLLILVFYDNLRRRRFTQRLQYQAEHDYLTDLPNRRSALKNLSKQRYGLTIMMLDIDNFKNINDTYGHICGDQILIEVAHRLKDVSDTYPCSVFRIGGDEFLIITPEPECEKTKDLLMYIRQQFQKPFFINGRKQYLKSCIGIVCSNSTGDLIQTSDLLTKVDIAMYAAKNAGKNSFAYFDDSMKAELDRKNRIEALLNNACLHDGFFIVYQPQIDTDTGKTYGYEALLRLKNSQIGAGQFIPIAEESETILTIGRIVTRKVIEQLSLWKKAGRTIHPVSINYSSKQLLDTEYVQFVKNLLVEYDISPSLIEIEITESVFLNKSEKSIQLFRDLAACGIKLSLDDFGTGYSSISYLTYIPVSKIKLDKSLIDLYLLDGKDSFVKNIIDLSHSLGLEITVEGVETEHQYDRLREFGCDYIQGYFFSRPITGAEIEKSVFK